MSILPVNSVLGSLASSALLPVASSSTGDSTTNNPSAVSNLVPTAAAAASPLSFGAPSANEAFLLQATLFATHTQFSVDGNGFTARGYITSLQFTTTSADSAGQDQSSVLQKIENRVNKFFDRLETRLGDKLPSDVKDFLNQLRDLIDQQIQQFPEPQLLTQAGTPGNAAIPGGAPNTSRPEATGTLGDQLEQFFDNLVARLLKRVSGKAPQDVLDWAKQTQDLIDQKLSSFPTSNSQAA
jgi:hypothetical protein